MTDIDTAIAYYEEIANNFEKYKRIHCITEYQLKKGSQSRQIAEWLKDYKRLKEQEPCEDYISRAYIESTVEELENICINGDEYILSLLSSIKNAPFVTPKSRTRRWIPVDERLPKEGKEVLVWYEYFRFGDYNCMWETYGIGYQIDGHWGGDVMGQKARCIAWMPLPEPYKAESEDEEQWIRK